MKVSGVEGWENMLKDRKKKLVSDTTLYEDLVMNFSEVVDGYVVSRSLDTMC